MEISNRKLLSRGMVAIGLAVAVSGLSGEVVAAEAQSGASSAGQQSVKASSLYQQEAEARRKIFAEQDKKIRDAQNLAFGEKLDVYRAVLRELKTITGAEAAARYQEFFRDLDALKMAEANRIMSQARNAVAEKRYSDALVLSSRAEQVALPEPDEAETSKPAESKLKEEVVELQEFCRLRMQSEERRGQTRVSAVMPDFEANQQKIQNLLKEAQVFYDGERYDEARNRLEQVFLIDPLQADAILLMDKIYRQVYTAGLYRHQADVAQMDASSIWQWVEPVFMSAMTDVVRAPVKRTSMADSTLAKMEKIIFPSVEFADVDVLTVARYLSEYSREFDPDKEGVSVTAGGRNSEALGRVTISLTQIPMSEVIRYICQDTGLKYRISGNSVEIGPNVDEMQRKSFPVRGDLISSITGDASDAANEGGAAMGGDPTMPPPDAMAPQGGGEGGENGIVLGRAGEGADSKTFLDTRAIASRPSATATSLMRYFRERGVRFDEGSSISYNKRAGRLIVRNTLENLQRLDELLRQLDAINTPLVMVEVKAIEISETNMQELGFNWSLGPLGTNVTESGTINADGSGWAFGQGSMRLANIRGTLDDWGIDSAVVRDWNIFASLFGSRYPFGSDLPFNLQLTINALSQNDHSEMLSAPKVLTTSGNKASVKMVKGYWFPEDWETYEIEDDDGTITITVPTPSFSNPTEVGLIFDVTPVVNPDNYTITLSLNPSVTNYLGKDSYPIYVEGILTYYEQQMIGGVWTRVLVQQETSTRFDVWMPIISRRDLNVNVTVYDGETIVLGGMVDSTTDYRTDKWPILGDLPFIGRFFQSRSENAVRNNLLLFVTTRLVNNDGIPIRRNQQHGAPDFNR